MARQRSNDICVILLYFSQTWRLGVVSLVENNDANHIICHYVDDDDDDDDDVANDIFCHYKAIQHDRINNFILPNEMIFPIDICLKTKMCLP